MKIKPKEILINIPIVLQFNSVDEIPLFASNINTIINGKLKIKYEELGTLGDQIVALFYSHRNHEFFALREEFKSLIEQEEIENNI